jgi:hypothetical protein
MNDPQLYRYVVCENDANFQTFLETQLGQFLFTGDDGYWGGGRALNCKPIAGKPTRADGYAISDTIHILLCPMAGEEHDTVLDANLNILADYDKSEDFLQSYAVC